jgi:hypothetical protein
LIGIDRCYVAMKKLDNWRKYSLSEWRKGENATVETDVEGEEISSDSEEIISIHSDGGDAEKVAEFVDQVVLGDDPSNEAEHNRGDEKEESIGESIFGDGDSHNEEEGDDGSVGESIFDSSSVHDEEEKNESEDIVEGLNTPVLDTIYLMIVMAKTRLLVMRES